jgi:hypothetical protein
MIPQKFGNYLHSDKSHILEHLNLQDGAPVHFSLANCVRRLLLDAENPCCNAALLM